MRQFIALTYGIACHLLFLVAVSLMAYSLWNGLQFSLFGIPNHHPWLNAILLFQFPIVHSLLLTKSGRSFMLKLAPARYSRDLQTTIFAILASLQLILVFGFWSPSGVVWWRASGPVIYILGAGYLFSWLFLLKSMSDADIRVQTGSLGWWSLFRGHSPQFSPFCPRGVFLACRQPIYLAFGLVVWTAATWTPDHLALALAWTTYLVVAPRFKERRYLSYFGGQFTEYQKQVPYMLPSIRSLFRGFLQKADLR